MAPNPAEHAIVVVRSSGSRSGMTGTMDRSDRRSVTLGLLVDRLEDDYQAAILSGIKDGAEEHQANLLCFVGGILRAPTRSHVQRNVVFEFAHRDNVDGLMVMSGTLGNTVGPAELARFCERYRPVPMCSIAVPLPGIPSILVDNATGMREAMQHLIRVHGYRRIAFVRGPEVNEEAEHRFSVYRAVLAEHGIVLRPELVAVGEFQRQSGEDAVRLLLDERRENLEAIVAASDYIALGVLDALRMRGVRVPEQVAVVGFDDVQDARFASPPLTTVRQPLYEQGKCAAETLLAMLRGSSVEPCVVLHTELVERRSCGCFSHRDALQTSSSVSEPVEVEHSLLSTGSEAIVADLAQALRATDRGVSERWLDGLLSAFVHDLQCSGDRFLSHLEQVLEEATIVGGDLSRWQDVVSELRRHAHHALHPDLERRLLAEDLVQRARLLIGSVVERYQAQYRRQTKDWARALSEIGEALITSLDLDARGRAVTEQLQRLRIDTCFLALYEERDDPLAGARLVLAYDAKCSTPSADLGATYPTRQLVPTAMLPQNRRYGYVVHPLFFGEQPLGLALFEMGLVEGAIYEALREQISASLKGAQLVQEGLEKDTEREVLLRDIGRRAEQLEEAYGALQTGQQQLLSSEKMASLGRLTASIAHEMNTPLAAVRAALVELGNLVAEYRASAGDSDVTAEDHRDIAREMSESIRLATGASERAAEFVRGIKTQTRDMQPHEHLLFNAVPFVEEALMLLSHALRKKGCSAVFRPDEAGLEIYGSPGRFSQVVTNLVTNAVDASEAKNGLIELSMERTARGVELSVRDDGPGISPEIMAKIFEPMFTTKPFGQGTGLGLAIVQDIVTSDFGGSIELESRLGEGATFRVLFPKRK